jgi:hypothetical protein
MSELTLTTELKGIEKSKADQIRSVFQPMADMLDHFDAAYDEVMGMEQSEEKSAKAKRLRLDIAKIRIEADKRRKEMKEEYLRAGKAIDGTANILKWAVTDKENSLKEIELYYQRIEEERLKKLQEDREAELAKYDFDGSSMDLSGMVDAVWNNFLTGIRANWESLKAAERKAEEDRIAREKKEKLFIERRLKLAPFAQFGALELLTDETSDKEFESLHEEMIEKNRLYQIEQARIQDENERLRKEAEEREAARIEAEKKAEAERKAADETARKEREAAEAKTAAAEAEARKAREEAAEVHRKAEEEKAAEERRRQEEAQRKAEEAKRAAMAPEKEKLVSYATDLLSKLNFVESPEAKSAIQEAAFVLTAASENM